MNPFDAPEHNVLDAREHARMAANLGVAAMLLATVSQCTMCLTVLPAAVLAGLSLRSAYLASQAAQEDELTTDLTRLGWFGGGASLIYSLLLLGVIVIYGLFMVLYVGVAFTAGILEAM